MKRSLENLSFFFFVLAACGGSSGVLAAQEPPATGTFEEAPAVPEAPPSPADLHPLTYPDGRVTRNDRCPVRKRTLNPKIESVYVNQQPVGFC